MKSFMYLHGKVRSIFVFFGLVLIGPVFGEAFRDTPLEITIVIPNYSASSTEWLRQHEDAGIQISKIAGQFLDAAANKNLTVEQRNRSLSLVEEFNVNVTAHSLIKIIDFEDQRVAFSGETARGRYPVVTVLANYGTAVIPYIIFALTDESQEKRQSLLCSVLISILGKKESANRIKSHMNIDTLSKTQLQNLAAAVTILE